MKKSYFLMAGLVLMAISITSCQKKPAQMVDEIYKNSGNHEFAKLLPYVVPDSVIPFNEGETESFVSYIVNFLPDSPMYTSYTVEVPEGSENADVVHFTVNTNFKDGMSYKEQGTLFKNKNGKWKLAFSRLPGDTIPAYTNSNEEKRTPELMRSLEYAYDMVMASRGLPEDQYAAACYYYYGVMTKKNLEKWFELVKSAAEKGYPKAQYWVGNSYDNGYGVKVDYEKAMEWYKKAAENGNKDALYGIGYLYSEGNGVIKNNEEAVKWYKRAIDEGNDVSAMNNLAVMYDNGEGVEKDKEKAFELYQKAANLGNSLAMNNVSWDYQTGEGTEKDMQKALEWATKSAEAGNYRGMNHLADIYYEGTGGIPRDYDKAFYWYKKSADDGNTYAEYKVGECYEYGRGVEKDKNTALQWYRKGHNKNYDPSTRGVLRIY